MDDAQARTIADSVELPESSGLADLEPDQYGQLICQPAGDGWDMWGFRKPGLNDAERASFEEWARQRIYLLLVTEDPAVDGWFKRKSDDGWQITARLHRDMPADPFI